MAAPISRVKFFCVILLLIATTAAQQPPPSPTPCPPDSQSAGQDSEESLPVLKSCVPSPEKAEAPALPPTTDPKEIVRRSVEIDHRTLELARNYTCQNHEIIKHLGRNGEVKSTEVKTFDINFYYGEEYARLIQKDEKPLSEKDQKKEDEKLEKFLAKYRNETLEEQEKRLAKEMNQREEGRAFLRDVVNAYDFRLAGEEPVDGVPSYVIEATPRADFQPTQPHAGMLKNIKGRLWIEKKNYNWVKVEAEATDTISYGLVLFRIHPGSHFLLEKTLINNEVWLLKRLDVVGGARIALFKNENIQEEDVLSNYKKFVTSVKVLPGFKEVPDPQPK
jgi:hypothetical protein